MPGKASRMKIDRAQLVEMMRARGDQEQADRLHAELPLQVDSDDYPELFQGLDLDLDAGDAARHGGPGPKQNMSGLPTSE